MSEGKTRARNLPKALKELREKMGLTQATLSWKSGVSEAHVQRIEQGRSENISLEIIEKLSKALGVTTIEFLERVYKDKEN